jgi:hypothetical protein
MIKYGIEWPNHATPVDIELAMVRNRGIVNGHGNGHTFHYKEAVRLLWPELDSHRWSELAAKELTRNGHKITSFMGPGSTAKTHEAAKWGLVEYFADPENTCVLVSSTDIRGLKLRIWGEISDLWQKAIDRYPNLAGHMMESRISITTDSLEDVELGDRQIRDMRKAINGIPCIQDKKYVGLAKYHGIKQKRLRLVGDELALMGGAFLKSIANLNNNADFQAVVCFNPNDPLDPGGQVAEPADGWQSHMEPTKTEVWDTRFLNGRCINFVGTDSPNFDDPNQPNRYPYLIGPKKISELISAFGKDSFEYYSQGVGVMKVGQLSHRVVTRDLCRKNHALDQPEWKSTSRTRIYALDAAYGGDRCVGGWGEFGEDPDGKMILCLHRPNIIHITTDDDPENIIARAVKDQCEVAEIPPENMFHDSTGRGRLGTALSRLWSPNTNPIEFGGPATQRPASKDVYLTDPNTRERRLKRCDEAFDRFVTELWWSIAYAIEGGQIRGLPEDVMDELCMRMWKLKSRDRKSVEPKSGTAENPGMKERTGRSPDLGDWFAVLLEGARQRGFEIARLGNGKTYTEGLNWLTERATGFRNLLKSKMLETR